MSDWSRRLFKERADLSLGIMNQRWPYTEKTVNGMIKILGEHNITTGRVLDLCCGNGRVSIHFALKGFKVTGVDYSKKYIEDARKKAVEYQVADKVKFLESDARALNYKVNNLSKLIDLQPFVVNEWPARR